MCILSFRNLRATINKCWRGWWGQSVKNITISNIWVDGPMSHQWCDSQIGMHVGNRQCHNAGCPSQFGKRDVMQLSQHDPHFHPSKLFCEFLATHCWYLQIYHLRLTVQGMVWIWLDLFFMNYVFLVVIRSSKFSFCSKWPTKCPPVISMHCHTVKFLTYIHVGYVKDTTKVLRDFTQFCSCYSRLVQGPQWSKEAWMTVSVFLTNSWCTLLPPAAALSQWEVKG